MPSARPVEILFVEDDDDHAELVMRGLADHRVANRILRVSDGQAALDALAKETPDVVLLDLRLPRVDGFEVLRTIKADPRLHRVPVVVLTTSLKEADVARAYDLHANAYVVKPIEFSAFLDLMRDLGFFWMAWNQSPGGCAA